MDSLTVGPLARFGLLERYRLNPIPLQMEAKRGVHPRLYFTAARIERLREAVRTTHAPLWAEVRDLADKAVRRGPPTYVLQDKGHGDEQLWQREVGNTMPLLAMAYVVTAETKYLDSARDWALASCSYPTWGVASMEGMDLAASHQIYGLAIVYDWCGADLGEVARLTIRETLIRRCNAIFPAAGLGRLFWANAYLSNHLWINSCALGTAGLALYDETDDAALWIGLALNRYQLTMSSLGPDGAGHEGLDYWGYGVEYMLKFMYLARDLLDVNLYNHPWWKNTASYRQYLSLPRNAWKPKDNIVDIADCQRASWYGPEDLLRALAHEYRDGHAQWLAQQIDDANVDSPESRWLNLLWYDPEIKPLPPNDLPTLHHFTDLDIVSARSDWSGDESLVVFKCGPFISHKAVMQFNRDPGGGHVHPDANHFVIFGAGEWLVRDDGGIVKKWTGQHNTLLIDGRGQIGEGKMWFDGSELLLLKARPHVVRVSSTPTLDYMVADATDAYPRNIGLHYYVRHLLFLKPDVLIAVDDVALGWPQPLELRFHPEQTRVAQEDGGYLIRGPGAKRASLRMELLTPQGVGVAYGDVAAPDPEGGPLSTLFTFRLTTSRAQWRNAVAFSWAKGDAKPPRVTLHVQGDAWQFAASGRSVTLNWGAAQP